MTTFSLKGPVALSKVIINFVEWSAYHLAPFDVLETPSKRALKVNIFPCIPGVFTIAWNKSGSNGGGRGVWKPGKDSTFFRNRLRNCKLLG